MLEFLADGSVGGILLLMGLVLALFAAYLLLAALCNRSLKQLAQSGRRAARMEAARPRSFGTRTQARWALAILLGLMGGLLGLIVFMTRVSR